MKHPFQLVTSGVSQLKSISIVTSVAAAAPMLMQVRSKAKNDTRKSCIAHTRTLKLGQHSLRYQHNSSANTVSFDNQPSSWLFVSGAVAGAYGAQVNLDLDLDNRLCGEALEQLKLSVKNRGIQLNVDSIVKDFNKLRSLERIRSGLIDEKEKIITKLKTLKDEQTGETSTENVQEATKKLMNKLSQVKQELTDSASLWELEEKVMINALRLPNDLHKSTPPAENVITRETGGNTGPPGTLSHIEIAEKFNLIKFSNAGPKAYYLKGDLVLAEMALSDTVCQYLQSKHFRHMAGPEFYKTPIMEGCGQEVHNADTVLTMLDDLKEQVEPMNHLAGVSPAMFVAYVAKTCIGDNVLPFNMFACGRRYQIGHLPGLYGAVQSTQAGLFSCVKRESLDQQFDETIDVIWNFLEPFGFPLRLCQNCAKELKREERRRIEIQMFAPSLQKFIPVASVSDLGDFVSRRLMVIHNQNHADIRSADLVHMVSGVALDITSLLAIWMEYSYKDQASFSLCPLPALQTS